jgi:hypothetical protein
VPATACGIGARVVNVFAAGSYSHVVARALDGSSVS